MPAGNSVGHASSSATSFAASVERAERAGDGDDDDDDDDEDDDDDDEAGEGLTVLEKGRFFCARM